MKMILLNGSPRKNWNTHRMLQEAERGAREMGADTELIHLFDLQYSDCVGCFACKVRDNKTEGVCARRDDLRAVLEKIADADALIIGSPVYYGDPTGEVISLIHRLIFPLMHYENTGIQLLKKPKKCALVMTMNVPEAMLDQVGYRAKFGGTADMLGRFLGSCETLFACDTLQFTDYSKYYAGMFDVQKKKEQRENQFPVDLRNAYELGKRLVQAE